MYAPKFQSWLTDEQRFSMALGYKLDRMAEDALSEIRKMAEDAMPKDPKKPEQPQTQDALLALYQQQMLANETGRYFGYPGNAFAQQSSNPYDMLTKMGGPYFS